MSAPTDPRLAYACALAVAIEGETAARWEVERVYEHAFVLRNATWPGALRVDHGRYSTPEDAYAVRVSFWQGGSVTISLGEARIGSRITSGVAVAARRVVAALPAALRRWETLAIQLQTEARNISRARALAAEIGNLIGSAPRKHVHDSDKLVVGDPLHGVRFELRGSDGGVSIDIEGRWIGETLALAIARAVREHSVGADQELTAAE